MAYNVKDKDVDIVLLRRRRKRRRQLIKFVAFLCFVFVIFGLYAKRDVWFPKLEGIGNKYQSVKSNKGELAEGNFPLSISGGIDYQTGSVGNSFLILSDAYIYIYDLDGRLYEDRQHAYANAMLQTAGKRALIYESGGNRFRVDGKNKTLYTKKLDSNIFFGRISNKGYVAVVTTSDTYICRLTVYDNSGDEIYSRNCIERVTDITFNKDSNGCIITTSDAQNGILYSKVISVSFNSKDDKWTSETFDAMCLETYYTDNGFFVLGDSKCAYYDSKGKIISTYNYPSDLVDCDFSDNRAAMIFNNEAKRHSYLTTISGPSDDPVETQFNSSAKCVKVVEDNILVLTKDGIAKHKFSGGNGSIINSEGSYDRFIYIDDYIFLLGYDRIDRIDYKI